MSNQYFHICEPETSIQVYGGRVVDHVVATLNMGLVLGLIGIW